MAVLFTLVAWSGVLDLNAQQVSFGPSIRVDDDTTGRNQLLPSLAADPAGNIYVAWEDLRNFGVTGKWDIYFSKSTDGGTTWSTNVKVSDDNPTHPGYPSLDVDAYGNIYVAWEDDRSGVNIYFAMSTDGGETWTNPNVKVNDSTPTGHYNPSLAADDSGNIYVTWSDERYDISDIYFAMSTDKGSTWTTPNVRVNSPPDGMQLMSCVAADDSGTIYAVWDDDRTGMRRVYFARSIDSGTTWSGNVRVSDTASLFTNYPSIDVDGEGTIYVAWDDGRGGDMDIYFSKSTDSGVTWTDPNVRVNDWAPRDQYMSSLTVDEPGNVYVAWTDMRRGTDDYDVYFALSTDRGNTWTDPNIRVNDSLTVFAQWPSLDVGDGGEIYISFNSMKDTIWSYDIYFAKGTVTGVEEEQETRSRRQEVRLLQNNPNPFAQMTDVRYEIPEQRAESREPVHVRLKIYNIAGGLVRTLLNEKEDPGIHSVRWDGRNDTGRRVLSGIYFCRFEVGAFKACRKVVLLR